MTWPTVDTSWNVMAHGDVRAEKWRGNWRMEWVASTLHTTSEHGVSTITTTDAYTSAASSRLNWRPRRFKWTRAFRRKTKSDFCACAITFLLAYTTQWPRPATRCLQHQQTECRGFRSGSWYLSLRQYAIRSEVVPAGMWDKDSAVPPKRWIRIPTKALQFIQQQMTHCFLPNTLQLITSLHASTLRHTAESRAQ